MVAVLQKWIDTTYLDAFDQTFFLNRVYWDSFTRSDLDAQLAPLVGKKWCTPGDHCEGADGVHQKWQIKSQKGCLGAGATVFSMSFPLFSAEDVSMLQGSLHLCDVFPAKGIAPLELSISDKPTRYQIENSRYDLVWYIESCFSDDQFFVFMIIRYY